MFTFKKLVTNFDATNKAIAISLFVFTLAFSFSVLKPENIVIAANDDKVMICHLDNGNSGPAFLQGCNYNAISVDPSSIDGSGNNDHTLHTCTGTSGTIFKDTIPATDINQDGTINDNDCFCIASGGTSSTYCKKTSTSSSTTPSSSSQTSSSSSSSSSSASSSSNSSSSSSSASGTSSSNASSSSSSLASSSANSSAVSTSSSSSSSKPTVVDNSGVGGVQDYDPQAYKAPKKLIKTGNDNLVMEILNLLKLN